MSRSVFLVCVVCAFVCRGVMGGGARVASPPPRSEPDLQRHPAQPGRGGGGGGEGRSCEQRGRQGVPARWEDHDGVKHTVS